MKPKDGVFVNIPTENVPSYVLSDKNDIEPPSYHQIYHDNTVTVYEDDELLIDGLPVGNMPILVINLILSATFDIVGFLMAALLATTHAARAGARLGLSLTLLRYGLYVGTKQADDDIKTHLNQSKFMRRISFLVIFCCCFHC
jgi:hypothetical protein